LRVEARGKLKPCPLGLKRGTVRGVGGNRVLDNLIIARLIAFDEKSRVIQAAPHFRATWKIGINICNQKFLRKARCWGRKKLLFDFE